MRCDFHTCIFLPLLETILLSWKQVESELTELPLEERIEYLNSLGVSESGLGNLIRATYSLLGLQTYFTSGEKVKNTIQILKSHKELIFKHIL